MTLWHPIYCAHGAEECAECTARGWKPAPAQEKQCHNCIHKDVPAASWPCRGCSTFEHWKAAAGVPVAHPTDGERDLAALCVRLVRRLREVSPDDKLAATATDYLNQRRYLNPLRIKAMGADDAAGVPVAHPTQPEQQR